MALKIFTLKRLLKKRWGKRPNSFKICRSGKSQISYRIFWRYHYYMGQSWFSAIFYSHSIKYRLCMVEPWYRRTYERDKRRRDVCKMGTVWSILTYNEIAQYMQWVFRKRTLEVQSDCGKNNKEIFKTSSQTYTISLYYEQKSKCG